MVKMTCWTRKLTFCIKNNLVEKCNIFSYCLLCLIIVMLCDKSVKCQSVEMSLVNSSTNGGNILAMSTNRQTPSTRSTKSHKHQPVESWENKNPSAERDQRLRNKVSG